MIDMGMGEQDEIHFPGAIQSALPVAFLNGRVALVHAAIYGKARTCGLNDMT